MSPTLWGPSRVAECPRCGWQWRVHQERDLDDRQRRCFRCGHLGVDIDGAIRGGDRVWVDRGAFALWPPAREELVAIRKPEGGLEVKRVIGVPGDTVQIDAQGRLRVNGTVRQLDSSQAWLRSIVVDDDAPRRRVPSRWRPVDEGRWAPGPLGFVIRPADAGREAGTRDSGWLLYHHMNVHDAGRADAVRDDDPANLSLTRQTFPVRDLRLSLRVHSPRGCRLEIAMWSEPAIVVGSTWVEAGSQRVRVGTSGSRMWRIGQGARELLEARSQWGAAPPADGIAAHLSAAHLSAARPVAIRVRAPGAVQIQRLWLGRSVRYDPPAVNMSLWRRGVRVGEDRFLVIGDNPPRSEDSRSSPEGVSRGQIIGRVIPLFPASPPDD